MQELWTMKQIFFVLSRELMFELRRSKLVVLTLLQPDFQIKSHKNWSNLPEISNLYHKKYYLYWTFSDSGRSSDVTSSEKNHTLNTVNCYDLYSDVHNRVARIRLYMRNNITSKPIKVSFSKFDTTNWQTVSRIDRNFKPVSSQLFEKELQLTFID